MSARRKGGKDKSSLEGAHAAVATRNVFFSAAGASRPLQPNNCTVSTCCASNTLSSRPAGAFTRETGWTQPKGLSASFLREVLMRSSLRGQYSRLCVPVAAPGETDASPSGQSEIASDSSQVNQRYVEWQHQILLHRASPLCYPYHSLHFTVDDLQVHSPMGASQEATEIAFILRSLLAGYIERCNQAAPPPISPLNTTRAVTALFFHALVGSSLYNQSYSGLTTEDPKTSFAVQPPQDEQKLKNGSLHLTYKSSINSTHINVCCNSFYYKVNMVDPSGRCLYDVPTIASALEAIQTHSRAQLEHFISHDVSVATQEDQMQLHQMFAQLSLLPDKVSADVRRRLRESSDVNAYSLDSLEAGLLTLVLEDAALATASLPTTAALPTPLSPSHWLHSTTSLYTSFKDSASWKVRVHALEIPPAAVVEWLSLSLQKLPLGRAASPATLPPSQLPPVDLSSSTPAADRCVGKVSPFSFEGRLSTIVLEHIVEFLDMWLPEKHRVPLRPYPTAPSPWSRAVRSPISSPASNEAGIQPFSDFCLSVIAAATRLKFCGGPGTVEPASVMLVHHHPICSIPTVVPLMSRAIHQYIQGRHGPAVLFTPDRMRQLKDDALRDVAALIDICWHLPCALFSSSLLRDAWERALYGVVDVAIAFFLRPPHRRIVGERRQTNVELSHAVSNLGLETECLVNCTLTQQVAEKETHPSRAEVTSSEVECSRLGIDAAVAAKEASALAAAIADALKKQ